jgi:branched-chain amino acid transport system permease protein
MVRFYQFALAGGFAGVAGALYAITYEIVTYDAANAVMSGNALLMTFIGGVGVFWGPIVGAVLITLLQSWMSLLSSAWLIYVGVLFIVMVIYAPGGIAGLVMAHRPIWQAGRLGALALPYLRIVPLGLVAIIGFVGLVELCTFATIGAGQGKTLVLFHRELDTGSAVPWVVAAALLAGGGGLMLRESRRFAAAWNSIGEEIKAEEPLR